MKLFLGLGNPERLYKFNRHNAGFLALDFIAKNENLTFKIKKKYEIAEKSSKEEKIFLIKPLTYMNKSGEAVVEFLKYHNLSTKDITVILDDSALPLGTIRIRGKGSDGGHKGLKDIIYSIGTDEITRIRIGIGSPPPKVSLEEWVLSDFFSEEKPVLEEVLKKVYKIFLMLCDNTPLSKVMNEFNRKSKTIYPPE